jgi:hypothetical protein
MSKNSAVSTPEASASFNKQLSLVEAKYDHTGVEANPDAYDQDADVFPYRAYDYKFGLEHGRRLGAKKRAIETLQTTGIKYDKIIVPVTDTDLRFEKERHDLNEHANYKKWVYNFFNRADPYELRLLHQLEPDVVKSQMQLIDEQAELQRRLAKLKQRGYPESEEDMKLIYMVQSGRLKVPDKSLLDPATYKASIQQNQLQENTNARARGLFNLNSWSTTNFEANKSKQNWKTTSPLQNWNVLGTKRSDGDQLMRAV